MHPVGFDAGSFEGLRCAFGAELRDPFCIRVYAALE